VDVDGRDLELRGSLHLVRDTRAHGCSDLGEVQPVLDDDVDLQRQTVVTPTYDDAALGAVPLEKPERPSLPHPSYDAVALGDDIADDLRDRLRADRDATMAGLRDEMRPPFHEREVRRWGQSPPGTVPSEPQIALVTLPALRQRVHT